MIWFHLAILCFSLFWLFVGPLAILQNQIAGGILFSSGLLFAVLSDFRVHITRRTFKFAPLLLPVALYLGIQAWKLPSPYSWILTLIMTIGLGCYMLPRLPVKWERILYQLGILTSIAAVQALFSLPLNQFALEQTTIPFIGTISAWILQLLGWTASANSGHLLIFYQGSSLEFVVTQEKIALIFFVQYLLAIWCTKFTLSANIKISLIKITTLLIGYMIFRFAICSAISAHFGGPLAIFSFPIPLLTSLLPLVIILTRFVKEIPINRPEIILVYRPTPKYSFVLLLLSVLALAWGITGFDPGRAKPKRILIDNSHSEWEDTKVHFDRTHFGTHSVYAYTELRRFLDLYFSVNVHDHGRLTPDDLSAVDVLLLKTPTHPYSRHEQKAILEFVEKGGGILLLGDHTNIMGMNTYLNEIAKPLGIYFRSDNAFPLDGPKIYNYVPVTKALRHPFLLSMESFLIMSGCTFGTLKPTVESVMSDYSLVSEQADYSRSSFFGASTADGADIIGPQRYIATSHFGKGRVICYGDSTIFSNFTFHDLGRRELLLGMMGYLSRSNLFPAWHKLIAQISGFVVCFVLLFGILRIGPLPSHQGMLFWVSLIFLSSILAIGWWKEHSYLMPTPKESISYTNVWFDQKGISLSGNNYQNLFNAFARYGLLPRKTDEIADDLGNTQFLVLIEPANEIKPKDINAIQSFIQGGGRLLIVDSSENNTSNKFIQAFKMNTKTKYISNELSTVDVGPPFSELANVSPFLLLDIAQYWHRGRPYFSKPSHFYARTPLKTVEGGTPKLQIQDTIVFAEQKLGKGAIYLTTLGSVFSDNSLGDPIFAGPPSKETRMQYEIIFEILNVIFLKENKAQGVAQKGE